MCRAVGPKNQEPNYRLTTLAQLRNRWLVSRRRSLAGATPRGAQLRLHDAALLARAGDDRAFRGFGAGRIDALGILGVDGYWQHRAGDELLVRIDAGPDGDFA